MDRVIKRSLREVGAVFETNELAYLAMTGKIESSFRDRWAYLLYRTRSQKMIVAREWNRADLVILSDGTPQAIIELKAMSLSNALKTTRDSLPINGFIEKMQQDENKAQRMLEKKGLHDITVPIYTVLLATHAKSNLPGRFKSLAKYRLYLDEAMRQTSVQKISEALYGKNILLADFFKGGEAYGIEVDIWYWLVKADAA